ncbi:MAG: polysaccharide deacetylase family protein [Oscillatoriales cyanobacterium RM2_1_1]|nr:polysaccharide deacetylase family protein [Oscillatoriales cyanobacterium SM2_3_0]NJO46778.1 polysaccharide deacetylase family protein [Oscillatoriales cyanobacterium RM2_1_1]
MMFRRFALGLGLSFGLTFSVIGLPLIRSAVAESKSPQTLCQASPEQRIEGIKPTLDSWLPAASRLLVNPEIGLSYLIQQIGNQAIIQSNISPWPTIHDQARLARVPVIMYHDVLPKKQVSFDVTIEAFTAHLQAIKENGLTPISLDQLVQHLRTGSALPEKPIVLTFDDGYLGHYEVVYSLLKKYNYPGAFSIYTDKIDGKIAGRSTLTWEQLREMAADPLVTIVSHSLSHPKDLTELSDFQLQQELIQSKKILEDQLRVPMRYFTYPEGKYDERVSAWVKVAGYEAAFTMENNVNRFSNESKSLLAIDRFGQGGIKRAVAEASGGLQLPPWGPGFDFRAPVSQHEIILGGIPLTLVSGGQPITVLADKRYFLEEILTKTEAVAAVDGGFFSLKHTTSNMIGPILSQNSGYFSPSNPFSPGNKSENPKIKDRPLILINPEGVKFVPFDPDRHNSLDGIGQELPGVTDAFVGAAFLVKHFQPQSRETFGNLYGFDAARHRAFWGIHRSGRPVIGVSAERIDSVTLGQLLAQAGFRDAVMVDSGASTSLAYRGKSLVKKYKPRKVPHMVALIEPKVAFHTDCKVAKY